MHSSAQEFLSPSQAASRLGVSIKALRLYERRGLITPLRTASGWRTYGPEQMARAGELVKLRRLGLSLGDIRRALAEGAADLPPELARHEARIVGAMRALADNLMAVKSLRAELTAPEGMALVLELPRPWEGERLVLPRIGALNFITGPLFSGKTGLAQALAEVLPGGRFIGLRRHASGHPSPEAQALMDMLRAEGATESSELMALAEALADGTGALVFDLIEDKLDRASQMALMAYLRGRGEGARTVFLMTRSNTILDLEQVGDGIVIHCPGDTGMPGTFPGTADFQRLVACLDEPEVVAQRTRIVSAWLGGIRG